MRDDAMATTKDLIAAVSAETGVPVATVTVHDRNLAEEGLRTPALRGRGISHVTTKDAANLIIAVAASRNVKDSAKTVRDYSSLFTAKPLLFGEVVRGVTFGDAIEALLEAIPGNRELYSGRHSEDVATIAMYGPRPRAVIAIRLPGTRGITEYEYEPVSKSGVPFADLTFISQFTQITLGRVGEVISAAE